MNVNKYHFESAFPCWVSSQHPDLYDERRRYNEIVAEKFFLLEEGKAVCVDGKPLKQVS